MTRYASPLGARTDAPWRSPSILQALARGVGSDDERWRECGDRGVRRLQAEGEPLAVGFGLVAAAVLARMHGRMDERGASLSRHTTYPPRWATHMYGGTPRPNSPGLRSGWATWRLTHDCASRRFLVSQRLGNLSQMGYALELWATAELWTARPSGLASLRTQRPC
jgi:hypothetical protein